MKILYLTYALLIFRIELFAQTAAISILPVSQIIDIHSTADVSITLEEIQQLHAYSIEVSYDPLLLNYISIIRMDFLSGWQTFFFPFIDTLNGKIKIDEAILGPYVQSGSGEIFKIVFEGKAEGDCNLSVSENDLRNLDNQSISAIINNAVVQIRSPLSVINDLVSNEPSYRINIYPNPFNSSAAIELETGTEDIKSLKILDCKGELIYNYSINLSYKAFKFRWDGKNILGYTVPSGVYLILAETTSNFLIKKLVMLK